MLFSLRKHTFFRQKYTGYPVYFLLHNISIAKRVQIIQTQKIKLEFSLINFRYHKVPGGADFAAHR